MQMLFRLIVCCSLLFCAPQTLAAHSLEPIVLQLPWCHQFQFAGYYAALEQGYYKDAGLEVSINSIKPQLNAVDEVTSGRAQFGVARAELLLHRLKGKPVVALATLLQHSAVIFLARKESGINTPQDMIGRRVMLLEGDNSAEYYAVLKSVGVDLDKITISPSSFDVQDLIDGKTDVFNAYSTNEPYFLEQKHIPYTIIKPIDYGIDFYGDTLFTSEKELTNHPDRVRAFRAASLRGWGYALSHKEEIFDLLIETYKVNKMKSHLRYEANAIEQLIVPGLIPLGQMLPERWEKMAATYAQLGLVKAEYSLENFLYTPPTIPDYTQLTKLASILIICFVAFFIILLLFMNQRLKQLLTARTEALRKSERIFREIYNNMESGVAVYEAADNGNDFRFKDINPAGCKYSKINREDILNKSVKEIFPGIVELGLFTVFQRVWQTGEPENHPTGAYKDDRLVCWVENYICKLPSGEIIAIYDDVTERHETEKMLKQRELAILQGKEEWQRSFDAIPDMVTIMDKDMRILRANKAFNLFFNIEIGELEEKFCYEIFHNSNHVCPHCPMIHARSHNSNIVETITYEHQGKIFQVSFSPIHDESGERQDFVHNARDITEHKRLEAELFQAHKLEAIGILAGGIAHDFNNILSAILGYSGLAKQELSPGSSADKDIDQVIVAGQRASALVQQILDFSRKTTQCLQLLQPHLVIEESLKMLRASLPTTVEFLTDIDQNCGTIMADPTKISQVIMNLYTNAFHALKDEKGTLQVTLHRQELDAEESRKYGLNPGPVIALSISDTGCGMDAETITHIFDPYFTTKEKGRGTGLGLAVVHGIIESYKGHIEVESKLGVGTTFRVFIPAFDQRTAAKKELEPQTAEPFGSERILVVDDEPMLIRISHRMLEDYGYKVTGTTSSQEALEKVRENPQQFDLIVTDQTMPGLTGFELTKAVLEIVPHMPIILCSGHSEITSEKSAMDVGIKKYLRKPIEGDELVKTVRMVLNEQKKLHPKNNEYDGF